MNVPFPFKVRQNPPQLLLPPYYWPSLFAQAFNTKLPLFDLWPLVHWLHLLHLLHPCALYLQTSWIASCTRRSATWASRYWPAPWDCLCIGARPRARAPRPASSTCPPMTTRWRIYTVCWRHARWNILIDVLQWRHCHCKPIFLFPFSISISLNPNPFPCFLGRWKRLIR